MYGVRAICVVNKAHHHLEAKYQPSVFVLTLQLVKLKILTHFNTTNATIYYFMPCCYLETKINTTDEYLFLFSVLYKKITPGPICIAVFGRTFLDVFMEQA